MKSKGGSFIIGNDVEISSDSLFMLVKPFAKICIGNRARIARHFQISSAFDVVEITIINMKMFLRLFVIKVLKQER